MKDYYSFAHTSIGFSHIAAKKVCQDFSLCVQDDAAAVLIVSDGHGSSNFPRSDRGSKFACEAAREAADGFLRDFSLEDLRNEALRDGIVTQLCKYILLRWNVRVDEDVQREPFTETEVEKVSVKYRGRYLRGEAAEHAYGCTLILVIVTRDFCLAIRNGDGQCVAVDGNGDFSTPVPWNENCEFNITTSLCDQDAIADFRYFYSPMPPAAIFINSDGVDDSYTSVEELYNLYRSICLKALSEGAGPAGDYVQAILPEITKRGSTDDVSIAGLLSPTALEGARTAMETAMDLRQQQLEKDRRELRKRALSRDIKLFERRKAKALAQQQDLRRHIQEAQARRGGFLDQISLFRKKADACEENLHSLLHDERSLVGMIEDTDSEIARLQQELTELESPPETKAPAERPEAAEETARRFDGTADSGEPFSAEPEPENTADRAAEHAPASQSATNPPE